MLLKDVHQSKLPVSPFNLARDKELAKQVQGALIWHNLLESPADGRFGRLSKHALMRFQSLLEIEDESGIGLETAKKLIETSDKKLNLIKAKTQNDLARKIINYLEDSNYHISSNSEQINIIYIEGITPEGILNNNTPNEWNDLRIVLKFVDKIPEITYKAIATVSPGRFYTDNPMNPKGAANFIGQAKAWHVGKHGSGKSKHTSLIQVAPLVVTRDRNCDFCVIGDPKDKGYFGINQHWGYDMPLDNIGLAGAGCLVGRSRQRHITFMNWVKSDIRYLMNKDYIHYSTVIRGVDLL